MLRYTIGSVVTLRKKIVGNFIKNTLCEFRANFMTMDRINDTQAKHRSQNFWFHNRDVFAELYR